MSGPAFHMQKLQWEASGESIIISSIGYMVTCIIIRFFPPIPKHAWTGKKDVRTVANSCVQIMGQTFGNFSGEKVCRMFNH